MLFNPKKLKVLPQEAGVYLMKGAQGKILYVGKAKNIRKRVKQYFTLSRDERAMVPLLIAQIEEIDTIVTFSEKEALLLENNLIKHHQPKYNILLKDDKTYISLVINHRHMWPMVKLIRYKGRPKKDGLTFGPYTSAFAAKQTLELMAQIFPLRQCSDQELKTRKRPCLLFGMKRCLAPCAGKCSKHEYDAAVKGAIEFLKGHDKVVIRKLEQEMKRASDQLEFERASMILQTIGHVKQIIEQGGSTVRTKGKDCDVFHFYHETDRYLIAKLSFREGRLIEVRHYPFQEPLSNQEEIWESFILQHYYQLKHLSPPEIFLPMELKKREVIEEILLEEMGAKVRILAPKKGEKAHLLSLAEKNAKTLFKNQQMQMLEQEKRLLELQERCALTNCPIRIECFDTSNISGTDLVACMVGFTDGVRDKKRTRLFIVKNVTKPDDYGALQEVLTRHYIKAKEKGKLPDLLILDGGKGQLHVATEVFKELEIASVDIISIAKEKGRHDKGLTAEMIYLPHQREPLRLSPRSPTLFFLQEIRDEAHRVAITFHRKRRAKRTIQSSLEKIPGIGPKKRALLLKYFGSVKRVMEASMEELEAVPGLSKKDIQRLANVK